MNERKDLRAVENEWIREVKGDCGFGIVFVEQL